MRGRATRRGANAPSASTAAAASNDAEANGDDAADEGGEPASWKVELESIMAGTHPALVEALEPHDQKMKAIVGQADRVRQLQMININALFECEKKQADDENKVRTARSRGGLLGAAVALHDRTRRHSRGRGLPGLACRAHAPAAVGGRIYARAAVVVCVCVRARAAPHVRRDARVMHRVRRAPSVQAQLEFFKARLIDTIEEKQKKAAAQQAGGRSRDADAKAKQAGDKRKRGEVVEEKPSCLPPSYMLKAEELKADMEEIATSVDHYSVRSAAAASDEMRGGSSTEAWFDRSRQLLHCNGQSFDRGATVHVYMQGQRVDDSWTLTSMNAVEVTLRDADSTKLKVTLAQLRNGRYVFRHGN
jgi:hypothetical protein